MIPSPASRGSEEIDMDEELELEVFRAGDYGRKGRWDVEALDRLVADYDPALQEAPVTLDHAQEGPALGWVAALARRGDRLLARLKDLNAGLVELLRAGAFKKRSVELYVALPETGRPYLKAVSFLGAGAPAVAGLRDLVFARDPRPVHFRAEQGEFLETEPLDPAPEAFALEPLREELRRSGRWLPRWEAQGLEAFLKTLGRLEGAGPSPGDDPTPRAWFVQFLRSLPPLVDLGESAPPEGRAQERLPTPSGRLSPASVTLHRRVLALRGERPELSYADALRRCAAE